MEDSALSLANLPEVGLEGLEDLDNFAQKTSKHHPHSTWLLETIKDLRQFDSLEKSHNRSLIMHTDIRDSIHHAPPHQKKV